MGRLVAIFVMKRATVRKRASPSAASKELFLDALLGREVFARNNQRAGRLEEFRVDQDGDTLVIREYVIGGAGLLERLGMAVGAVLGRRLGSGYVARWDQLDISDPSHLRLLCGVEELSKA